jgi:hypothetical protein
MSRGGNGTWDLSPNDIDALRHVMSLVDALAIELAERNGEESWQAIEWAERQMEAGV